MAILRDVLICYDGTNRNLCTGSIVQIKFLDDEVVDSLSTAPPGEPVGVLPATAISNPAYKVFLDSSQSNNSSWELMKMTPKEAFRMLSHIFHGKGPGKMKQEKRMKQYQEDLKAKQMKTSDSPLLAVDKMREAQAQLKTPYLMHPVFQIRTSLIPKNF